MKGRSLCQVPRRITQFCRAPFPSHGLQLPATNSFVISILCLSLLFFFYSRLLSLHCTISTTKRKHGLLGNSEIQFSVPFTILAMFLKDMLDIFQGIYVCNTYVLNIIYIYFTFTEIWHIIIFWAYCNILIIKLRFSKYKH